MSEASSSKIEGTESGKPKSLEADQATPGTGGKSIAAYFGMGGTGMMVLLQQIKLRQQRKLAPLSTFWFHDLSADLDNWTNQGVKEGWIRVSNILRTVLFQGGAAMTPPIAEFCTQNFLPTRLSNGPLPARLVNFYYHSLSGGTGGQVVPQMISKLVGGGIHIAFSFVGREQLIYRTNLVYNLPKVNELSTRPNMRFLSVLIDNEALEEHPLVNRDYVRRLEAEVELPFYPPGYHLIDNMAIRIAEMIMHSREALFGKPKLHDIPDIYTCFATAGLLRKGVSFVVPCLWPLTPEYEFNLDRTLEAYILLALEKGCLCPRTNLQETKVVFLIAELPKDSPLLRDQEKAKGVEKFVKDLFGGAGPNVFYAFVPCQEERGIRLSLLLHAPRSATFTQIRDTKTEELSDGLEAWKTNINTLQDTSIVESLLADATRHNINFKEEDINRLVQEAISKVSNLKPEALQSAVTNLDRLIPSSTSA